MGLLIFLTLVICLIVCGRILLSIYRREKRIWNNGRCRCGSSWIMVQNDNYGPKVYRCNKCYEYIAITTEVDVHREGKRR